LRLRPHHLSLRLGHGLDDDGAHGGLAGRPGLGRGLGLGAGGELHVGFVLLLLLDCAFWHSLPALRRAVVCAPRELLVAVPGVTGFRAF
jgi:hypothetical protein